MRPSRFVVLAISCGLLSCSGQSGLLVLDGEGDHAASQHPIINGLPPDAPHHTAVAGLHQLTNSGSVYVSPFCSGTLITPTVVVTAAHCLNTGNGPKVKTMKPGNLAIYVGGDEPAVDILDHLYLVSETDIHTGYNPYALTDDIALVRLASPVPGVVPVGHLPTSQGFTGADVLADLTLNFAGFGQDENGDSGVKLQVDGTLGGLGCSVGGCPDGGDAATQISYSQPTSGPCFGDSGGPAFVDRAGTIFVGGLTSYGDSGCSVYGVSTRVDAFQSYIDAFIGVPPEPPDCSADGICNGDCAPGDDPDCALPPDCSTDGFCNPECLAGEDADCSSGEVCGNGTCGVDESCDGRYGTVDCPTDCDGVTNGRPSNRWCEVEGLCDGPGCP